MTEQELQILEAMLSRLEQCETTNKLLLDANKELVRSNKALSESLETLRYEYECYSENSRYEINDPREVSGSCFYPNIYSIDETMDALINSNRSLCRFGDGEFACISGNLRASFTTEFNEDLALRLTEVLACREENIMIAIADNYGNLSSYIPQTRREIRSYMTPKVRKEHVKLLDDSRYYYNAYVTRPFIFLYNDMERMARYFNGLKQIWQNRNVVIVEGCNTGFGAGNDLLDGCSGIKRIIAPAQDAYEKYEEIFEAAVSQSEDSLYLIALGPAATVLAYDLAKTGRRSIDIGHLDIEYEWFRRGEYRTLIPCKYVNEVSGGTSPEPITDDLYRSQIITSIL